MNSNRNSCYNLNQTSPQTMNNNQDWTASQMHFGNDMIVKNYDGSLTQLPPPQYVFSRDNIMGSIEMIRKTQHEENNDFVKKMLVEHYSHNYAMVHALSLNLLGIFAMALEAILLINRSMNDHVYLNYAGIFIGIYIILCGFLAAILAKFKERRLLIATLIMHAIASVVTFIVLFLQNFYILNEPCNSKCKPNILKALAIVGLLSSVISFVYFLVISYKTKIASSNKMDTSQLDAINNNLRTTFRTSTAVE